MKGKTNEEIKAEREEAIEEAKDKLYHKLRLNYETLEVIDSFFENAPHDANPLWFLSKSIELLSTADVVYFCEGWETARGCKIEHDCAQAYDIEIIKD